MWKKIASKKIIETEFFNIDQDRCLKRNGKIVEQYYKINRPDIIVVAAFTKELELILISQYRYPVSSTELELPAGHIDPEDETPIAAAEREFLEETGYKADLQEIAKTYASSGIMNNKIHFFIGLNAKKIAEPKLDKHEEIEVKLTPWTEALKLVKENQIKDTASLTGLLLAKEFLSNNS